MITAFMNQIESAGRFLIPLLLKELLFSSLVFAFIFGLTGIFRRLPSRWRLGLWSLVLIRLLLPPDLNHAYSARNLLNGLVDQLNLSIYPSNNDPFLFLGLETESRPVDQWNTEEAHRTDLLVMSMGMIIWMAGSGVFLFIYAKKTIQYRRLLKTALHINDKRIAQIILKWRRLFKIKRTIHAVASEKYRSPFTMGLLRPVIFLPKKFLDKPHARHLESIIAHEMAHIRRFDDLWIKLQNMIQMLYFFHPIVWLTNGRIHHERECVCDSMVLSQRKISREKYGNGLLAVLKYTLSGSNRIGLVPGFGQRHRSWRIRIQRIKGEHSMKKYQYLILGSVLVLVAGIVLPMAGKQSKSITVEDSGQTAPQQEASIVLSTPILGGRIRSGYGNRMNPFTNKKDFHQGVDIPMEKDSPVRAAADGVVLKAVEIDNSHSGKYVLLEHAQGFRTRYTHLEEVLVKKDQAVKSGDIIGLVGETGQSMGPHLHFELIKDEKPVNPEDYIKF